MTDPELIAGIIARDNRAIQFLVGTYHKQVIKTAYHFVRDMDDAEDLAQDVCVEILESVRNFKGASSLSTWIYRITVNKSLNFVRKNKRKQVIGQIENLFRRPQESQTRTICEPSGNNHSIEDKERREMLEKCINSLPENQRIAFVLNKYEDLPYKQVAEIMNVSLASVESLLQRAKQNLQKRLVNHFSEYAIKN